MDRQDGPACGEIVVALGTTGREETRETQARRETEGREATREHEDATARPGAQGPREPQGRMEPRVHVGKGACKELPEPREIPEPRASRAPKELKDLRDLLEQREMKAWPDRRSRALLGPRDPKASPARQGCWASPDPAVKAVRLEQRGNRDSQEFREGMAAPD